MRIKRYKQARRILDFYKRNFGLREPYQILGECSPTNLFFTWQSPYHTVDGTFCQAALTGKIQLKEQLPKYFGGEIKLGELLCLDFLGPIRWMRQNLSVSVVTTSCVIEELTVLGKKLTGAVFIAKRFQLRNCVHGRKRISATECIKLMIGKV